VPTRIAIVTCDELLPNGHDDDATLVVALMSAGADVQVASWSDRAFRWGDCDLAVIRSTWDYTGRRKEFLSWLASVPRLANPAHVVAPNTDKVYLRAIAKAGLPVVPTVFAEPGEAVVLPTAGEFVVKPSVGAGSRGAGRFDADLPTDREAAVRHAAQLHADGLTVLIQPYLSAVDAVGESGLVYIDGQFSHAIRKGRMLAEGARYSSNSQALYIEENITARTPSAAELATGAQILSELSPDGPLLYARVDLLPGPDGPVLVEAELTEPSLFLDFGSSDNPSTDAASKLARAILDYAGR
jgi:glutathione synthase/RimK-type ligase-like ATP-grasp enzyme